MFPQHVYKGPQLHNKFAFFLSICRSNSPLTGLCTQMLTFSDDTLFKVIKPVYTFIVELYDPRQERFMPVAEL